MQPAFRDYARQIVTNAQTLASALRERKFDLVTGGTDNHLVLVDLRGKNLTGAEAAARLEEAGIVANKNGIPNDPLGPRVTSGLRLGVPAITTLGMREPEMEWIAERIARALHGDGGAGELEKIRHEVRELCERFAEGGAS